MKIWTDLSTVLSQFTRVTDRRTDRILIARPRLHFIQRGKNCCVAVVDCVDCSELPGDAHHSGSVRFLFLCLQKLSCDQRWTRAEFIYGVDSVFVGHVMNMLCLVATCGSRQL